MKTGSGWLLLIAVTFLTQANLFACSGSRPVAVPGVTVLNDLGWPTGAVELINDPLRTEGWNPWFSGWVSDVQYFLFRITNSSDANRLIKRLAAIQTNVYLKLNPAAEAGMLAFTTVMKQGNGHAAVFSLGNQRVLNSSQSGKTVSQPVAKPAVALPPTLTFYVGHPAVDLAKLEIPTNVMVMAEITDAQRKEKPGDSAFKAIDDFVSRIRAPQSPAPALQK